MTAPWAPERGWTGPPRTFHVALVALYSVENAGLRYLSAALRRAGFQTTLVFLRDWVNNRLEMPSEEDLALALEILSQKKVDSSPACTRWPAN